MRFIFYLSLQELGLPFGQRFEFSRLWFRKYRGKEGNTDVRCTSVSFLWEHEIDKSCFHSKVFRYSFSGTVAIFFSRTQRAIMRGSQANCDLISLWATWRHRAFWVSRQHVRLGLILFILCLLIVRWQSANNRELQTQQCFENYILAGMAKRKDKPSTKRLPPTFLIDWHLPNQPIKITSVACFSSMQIFSRVWKMQTGWLKK